MGMQKGQGEGEIPPFPLPDLENNRKIKNKY